jgi:Protein of unknown function with HXXEE motif
MRKTVTYGLFAAWAVHDLEEIAGVVYWSRRVVPKLRRRHPWVPDRVWRAASIDPATMAMAVGMMGLAVAGAAIAGERTGGRSPLFQAAIAGFGLHGVTHLAGSALARDYTPGVLTAPVLVIPYALWARRQLARAGVWRPISTADAALSLAVAGGLVAAAQGGAKLLGARPRSRNR